MSAGLTLVDMSRVSYLRVGSPPTESRSHWLKRKARLAAVLVAVFVLGMWASYLLTKLPPN